MEIRSLIVWHQQGTRAGHCVFIRSQPLSVIYEQYQDEDRFLYLTYCEEDPFGCVS